jgi:hypothetical protein
MILKYILIILNSSVDCILSNIGFKHTLSWYSIQKINLLA